MVPMPWWLGGSRGWFTQCSTKSSPPPCPRSNSGGWQRKTRSSRTSGRYQHVGLVLTPHPRFFWLRLHSSPRNTPFRSVAPRTGAPRVKTGVITLTLRLWGRGCVLRARLEMPLHIPACMVQPGRSDAPRMARDTSVFIDWR